MSRLTSCYFCGTADETLSEYAVVPQTLQSAADAAESPSVVLCPRCHEKVLSVVRPILEVVDEAPAPSSEADDADPALSADRQVAVTFGEKDAPVGSDDASITDPVSASAPASGEAGGDATNVDGPSDAADSPRGYRQVRRFLQNREFPMDRETVVSLVTSAYDLSEENCRAALDHAVETGVIRQADGRLRRP